uniref:MI domain-containing protein n=1 Tax=Dendroctonus ponderosae TaxID=77166 RepID=A0AAR5QBH3_DENPD
MPLKNKVKSSSVRNVSRKQLRKDKRKEKKVKRNDYFSKFKKSVSSGELDSAEELSDKRGKSTRKKQAASERKPPKVLDGNKTFTIEEIYRKEKREQQKMEKGMSKQRKQQLLQANAAEDHTIRKLEKQLKLNKKKTKAIPKSFSEDGLDYLLEVCDSDYLKKAASAAPDGNDNFEEDFALITGKNLTNQKSLTDDGSADESELEDFLNQDDDESESNEDQDMEEDDDSSDDSSSLETDGHIANNKSKVMMKKQPKDSDSDVESDFISEIDDNSDAGESANITTQNKVKRKLEGLGDEKNHNKKPKLGFPVETPRDKSGELSDSDIDSDSENLITSKAREDVWEDIYGRLRSSDGSVLENKSNKYIPPAIRAKMEASGSDDKKHKEKIDRLKKQLKGLLNRLAESNMNSIASQIETLYMSNSRNDMSETLTSLIITSLIDTVSTPERLLIEHILLIAILHANVGTEVGAHFLQNVAQKFDFHLNSSDDVQNKSLDNTVNVLAQLYNFKVFDAKLLYEILHKLAENFEEKNVECILHILRSVGFGLRKDDPLALKTLILELQKQAASASKGKVSNSRVKFLLDILLAIKNNNVTKIPNYDVADSEHMKKLMKGFIRKGNYVSPLNISLEDLLNAEQRGKWWVVGSAWTGKTETINKKEESLKTDGFSSKLLKMAKQQRMNTDTRRDVFCIIMSAEDYLDAFEKLLRLGLKNQQEREIVHVIIHCCLQEKTFNAFYAVLAQKFCEYDRRFQMTIKCAVWDKLNALSSHSGLQLSNLAKFLIHLFIQKGLPISTLKNIEFSDLDKVSLRLIRQILLGILMHSDVEAVQGVFTNVAMSDKLKMFRKSMRLFIHHFLLRNLKEGAVPEQEKHLLETRAKMVEKILTVKESKSSW